MRISRRTFLTTTLSTGATAGAIGLYSWRVEPGWISVTTVQLKLPHLEQSFHGYRLVQLSDLHCDNSWMSSERLAGIVALANEQKPDLTVITGDFVTTYFANVANVLANLKDLRARDGIFGILGNHDHWSGVEWVRPMIQANGIRELNNASYTIERSDGSMLHLVGLDDLWPVPGIIVPLQQHLGLVQNLADQLPTRGAAILLVHEPDFADIATTVGRFDLQLSGHSHGGQVRLPWYGAIYTPSFGRLYPDGLYQTGKLWHYTSRGLGMVPPQVRFDCRPEITVFELL